jgi:hydrogenase small subunit
MASVMLQGIKEIDVLWITAGLGCDGDTISITAATQPSIEDLVLGALPGIPKVKFHNPVLAFEAGDEFMSYFHRAAEGQLSPFILVIEGSIPNEQNKDEGYWAALGTDRQTGQPILTCDWIDRLAGRAWAVVAAGTCATYGGIHAMQGNPTGCMGLADYLGRDWKSSAGIPIVNVPGCPVLPDNFMEVLLYLLYHAAGLAPLIPLDEVLRPTWLFGQTVHREAGLLGTRCELQCRKARLDKRHRRLSQCGRHLHWLHNAWISGQVYALYESTAGFIALFPCCSDVWPGYQDASKIYPELA